MIQLYPSNCDVKWV